MNKIFKQKGDDHLQNLDKRLQSYANEIIMKPLDTLRTLSKGSLAVLTPLAAASLISSDLNAQCGVATAVFDTALGDAGLLDIDGDGNFDFEFYDSLNQLFMTPISTISIGRTNPINVRVAPYGGNINGGNNYTTGTYLEFFTTLTSGIVSTTYIPIKNSAGHLGFVEITFDGAGGFSIDVNQSGIANASGNAIAGNCSSLEVVLPVSLIGFNAESRNKGIALCWKTASELNNQGFEIQRSSDGESFYKIGWVDGAGTIDNIMEYSYFDNDVRPNVPYYYRLKQIDFDGKFEYSPIRNATIEGSQEIEILAVYPTPVGTSEINLEINSKTTNELSYKLFDAFGQQVIAQVQTVTSGLNTIYISTSGLSNGTYFLKIDVLNLSEYKKLIIQK